MWTYIEKELASNGSSYTIEWRVGQVWATHGIFDCHFVEPFSVKLSKPRYVDRHKIFQFNEAFSVTGLPQQCLWGLVGHAG